MSTATEIAPAADTVAELEPEFEAEAEVEVEAKAEATAAAEAADESTTLKVVRGTFTLYMTKSYVEQALPKNVVITPINAWLHSVGGSMTSTTYQIKSGDIDLRNGTGTLVMDGGTVLTDIKSGQSMVAFDIRFNLATHTIDFTWKSPDGDVPVQALAVAGPGQGGVWGRSGSYTAAEVYFRRDAAQFLNDLLKSTAFLDEGLFGAVAAQFELDASAPTDGIVHWGLEN